MLIYGVIKAQSKAQKMGEILLNLAFGKFGVNVSEHPQGGFNFHLPLFSKILMNTG